MVKERDANRDAANELAILRSARDERERSFEQQIEALREAKESLSAQFHEIGGKLLGEARKAFLEQANEKFTQAVTPVEALLKTYQEKLQSVEKERVDHYAGLREAVELVRAGQGQVRDETRNLVNALRSSPKARGRWGEQILRNVLEHAGLSEYADFRTEVSVDGEDGKLRPDVVVRLPGGRQLIIDAKCSLNAYLDACDEIDEDKRAACFRAHVASIRDPRPAIGLQGLLGAVRRFGRAGGDVRARRAFPQRRAGDRPDALGMGVRAQGAARDSDQPRRRRAHRGPLLGAVGAQ